MSRNQDNDVADHEAVADQPVEPGQGPPVDTTHITEQLEALLADIGEAQERSRPD